MTAVVAVPIGPGSGPGLGLDPGLPQLAAGIDPVQARLLFAALPMETGPAGHTVLDAERMHTDYRPGISCRFSYRLRLGAPDGTAWTDFGELLVDPAGLHVRWYVDDPALPALRTATDPARIGDRLDAWAGTTAARRINPAQIGKHLDTRAGTASRWRIEPVRYRAGTRCVLRFRRTDDALELFGKLCRPAGGHDTAHQASMKRQLAETLDAERGSGSPRPSVPAVIGWDERLGLVVHAAAPGRSLGALAFDATLPASVRLGAVYAAGRELAGLHASAGVPAPVRTFADDVAELPGYLAAAWHADPALAERYARLVGIAGSLPGAPGDLALGHGALRTDQLLVGASGIQLLDLDGLSWSEPARDVGNLLGYLTWRAARRPAQRDAVASARAAFLDGYGEQARWDGSRMRVYEAVTLLKIAGRVHRGLRHNEWPQVPALVDRAADLLATHRPTSRPEAVLPASNLLASHRPHHPVTSRPGAVLSAATDPARMTTELAPLLAGTGTPPASVLGADLLAYRADRTAVVRYRLGSGQVLLGKIYPDAERALRTYDIHRRLRAALDSTHHLSAGGGRINGTPDHDDPADDVWIRGDSTHHGPIGDVPISDGATHAGPANGGPTDTGPADAVGDRPGSAETLGVVPELGMLVMRSVEGQPLDRTPDPAAAARAAGAWLAGLHGSSAVLPRRLDTADERANVAAWARIVQVGFPELAVPVRELTARLASAIGTVPVRRDVPIHKDFHHQHVLLNAGGRIRVLDLDEARMGDPALDVAHFGAYLDLLALRLPAPAPVPVCATLHNPPRAARHDSYPREATLHEAAWCASTPRDSTLHQPAVRDAFKVGYCSRRGWPPDDVYHMFSAWTCLKIAKQLATGRGPHPRPTGRAAHDQARSMIDRGLAWLG